MGKVIYHVITTYHLFEFMTHKMLYNPDNESILYIPEFFKEKYDNLDMLVDSGIFTEIKVVRYRKIKDSKDIFLQMNEILKSEKGEFEQADQIHIAGAQYWISEWLIRLNIPFFFWEEAAGAITGGESLKRDVQFLNKKMYEMASSNHMFSGKNKIVIARYCNFNAQQNDFNKENCIDYNITRELKKLSNKQLNIVKLFFRVPEIEQDNIEQDNNVIILTNHYANMGLMSVDEQASMYLHMVDYYMKGKQIIFKQHPDDFLYYKLLIPKSKQIKEKFPAELLSICIKKENCNMIATVASTGIRNIKSDYKDCLEFNNEYLHSYLKDHSYFWALSMLNRIRSIEKKKKCFAIGCNFRQLNNLYQYGLLQEKPDLYELLAEDVSLSLSSLEGDYVLIIDDPNYDNFLNEIKKYINQKTILIFINFKHESLFAELFTKEKLLQHLIYKNIEFYKKKNIDLIESVSYQGIYIYTENESIRRELINMEGEYELINTGIKTRISETSDKDEQIAVLKGILDATEKRLLYYINEEKVKKENKL